MTDTQFNILSITGITLLLWWLFRERQVNAVSVPPTQSPALPVGWSDPMDSAYNGSTPTSGPFAPVSAPNLAINIANQSAGQMSQAYMPLFGFVGMAQGTMYQ